MASDTNASAVMATLYRDGFADTYQVITPLRRRRTYLSLLVEEV